MQATKDFLNADIERAQEYVNEVFETVKRRNSFEFEFHQAVKEIFDSLIPLLAVEPIYMEKNILERI